MPFLPMWLMPGKTYGLILHRWKFEVVRNLRLLKYYFDEVKPYLIVDSRESLDVRPDLEYDICSEWSSHDLTEEHFETIDVYSDAGECFLNSNNAFSNLARLLKPEGIVTIELTGFGGDGGVYHEGSYKPMLDFRFKSFGLRPTELFRGDDSLVKFSYQKFFDG
ncbi:hypothetical protein ACJJIK_19285 [Microbulbifer sp. ZKSA006]|uniref:hypothetical protein n=1 Tax=Microbulbifer sp. ZKSA006 TaxID=3243390 RepID=UPI00403A6E28